jgi:hypothetical protein
MPARGHTCLNKILQKSPQEWVDFENPVHTVTPQSGWNTNSQTKV